MLINSDSPIDKIVGYFTGSFSRTSATSINTHDIAHGLNFAPLYILQWSTSSSFSPAYSENGFVSGTENALSAQVDGSTIYVGGYVPSGGGTVTFYYRILLFMPPDIDADVYNFTADGLDDFIINSDFNYPKIHLEGRLNATGGTIAHNLGYYPQIEVWGHRPSDNRIVHQLFSGTSNISVVEGAQVTTSNLIIHPIGSAYDYWYYRIYLDEV